MAPLIGVLVGLFIFIRVAEIVSDFRINEGKDYDL